MKKLKCIILIAALAIFNVRVVEAAEDKCADLKLYAKSDYLGTTNVYMKYHTSVTNTHPYYTYTFTDNHQLYAVYCRNAGFSAGHDANVKTYNCSDTVFDPTDTNENKKAYDAGIMEILMSGYSKENASEYTSTTGLSADAGYVATNVAIRVFELLWRTQNTNGGNGKASNLAHQYIANLILSDSELQPLIKEATGEIRDKFKNTLTVDGWTVNGTNVGNDTNNPVYKEARRLIKLALEATIEYRKEGAATIEVINRKPIIQKKTIKNGENSSTYEASLTYNFKIENFRSENAYARVSFECPNCTAAHGITYETYINDNKESFNGVNILDRIDSEGKFSVKIVIRGTTPQFNCEQLKYKLKVKYKDKSIQGEAYDLYSSGHSESASYQHFYFLYSRDSERELTLDNTVDVCSLNCNNLKELCHAGNATACERLDVEYGGDCVECTAYVSNVKCDIDDQDIYIKEGLELDNNTNACVLPAEKDVKLNILQCIVNNEDKAGNSYKAQELTSNKYCSVYCKEDYHFVLPGIKEVRSGRYFSLQATVNGTKSCYTSKIDPYDTFADDLEAARQDVIKAYNEWSYYYNALHNGNTLYSPHTDSASAPCGCGNGKGQTPCHTIRTSYAGYRIEFEYDYYTLDGDHSTPPGVIDNSHDGGYASCSCSGCEGNPGSEDNLKKYIESKLGKVTTHIAVTDIDPEKGNSYSYSTSDGAVGRLQTAIYYYYYLLNSYNSCSGYSNATYSALNPKPFNYGWKMDYNYDPNIYYWYQEKYMNDVMSDELETIGSVEMDDDYKQTNCYGNVNNDYTCKSNSDNNKNADVDLKKTFMCYHTTGDEYECSLRTIAVSNAKYVSQSMNVKGEYITPTQFQRIYPTNAIVVAGKDESIENGSSLPNGLPVSANTTQGVYTYTLRAENLGEYYSTVKEDLGRVWGADDSVVVKTLEELQACYKDTAMQENVKVDDTYIYNGVYVCAYKVNCPDCPIECDPDGCENPDCPPNNCPIECDNCIITNGTHNFEYRPITSGNLNPNDRVLGKNWRWDNNISDAVELKAYTTTKEIETMGEEVYDSTNKNNYVLKVKMDSGLMSAIREYNNQHDENYLNNTLKCYNLEENGTKYNNVFCYSTFLDEMLESHENNFVLKKDNTEHKVKDIRPSTEAERKNSKNSDYWTTWSKAIADETWNITTVNSLAISTNAKTTSYNSEIGIGPSWK